MPCGRSTPKLHQPARVWFSWAQATVPDLTQEQVVAAIRAFKRGSAAGPSGLHGAHLREALAGAHDEGAPHLTIVVLLLAHGEAPADLAPHLAGATLHALPKGDTDDQQIPLRGCCGPGPAVSVAAPSRCRHPAGTGSGGPYRPPVGAAECRQCGQDFRKVGLPQRIQRGRPVSFATPGPAAPARPGPMGGVVL